MVIRKIMSIFSNLGARLPKDLTLTSLNKILFFGTNWTLEYGLDFIPFYEEDNVPVD
jgi:hypothetical protein